VRRQGLNFNHLDGHRICGSPRNDPIDRFVAIEAHRGCANSANVDLIFALAEAR
jgi:hypothetical protein